MSMLVSGLLRTAAIAAFVLAAGSVAAQTATPKRGGVFTHYVTLEPANLDCHQDLTIFWLGLAKPAYSGLLRFDQFKYPNVVGDLAESWTISPDGLTYTFKLQSAAKFHDGSPFTSQDIKATFDRIRNPPPNVPSVRKADFADVAAIEAPDATTVVFRLSQPNAALLDLIAAPHNCVYSARKLQENPVYPATEVMGTGPFMFTEWQKGTLATGKRFDGYFRPGLPYLDGYRTLVMNAPAAVNAISVGQIDATLRSFTPPETTTVRGRLGDQVVVQTGPLSLQNLVNINFRRKPYDDARVRRALTMSIDRRGALPAMQRLTNVHGVGGAMPPGYDLALPPAEVEKFPGLGHDIAAARAEARKLLAEAGQSGLKPTLLTQPSGTFATLAVFVADQLRTIGLEAVMDQVDGPVYRMRQLNGEFDLNIDTNNVPSDDPTVMLAKHMPGSSNNFGRTVDPALTDLFQKQKITLDRDQRRQYVNELERRLLSEAYYMPLFWSGQAAVLRSYVRGWQVTSSLNMGYDLTEVWLDK